MKAPSPLLGFNNNIRHRGRVFHIQTEDSGIKHPHIITHLFADGGRILKTTKTSYAEHVGGDRMAETVRQMMKEQHKAMFLALRSGQLDHLLDSGEAGGAPPPSSRAQAVPVPERAERRRPASSPTRLETPRAKLDSRPTVHDIPTPPPQPRVAADAPTLVMEAPAGANDPEIEVDLDLDVDALERAAEAAQTPIFQQVNDLPPPPAAVLGRRAGRGGVYRSVAPPDTTASAPPDGGGAYAPSRPAAIFASRPAEGASIFGEDLISEKSLDEVILSYLAEDLDPPSQR